MVGEEGLEPSRHFCQRILSPSRIPIPPLAHVDIQQYTKMEAPTGNAPVYAVLQTAA